MQARGGIDCHGGERRRGVSGRLSKRSGIASVPGFEVVVKAVNLPRQEPSRQADRVMVDTARTQAFGASYLI